MVRTEVQRLESGIQAQVSMTQAHALSVMLAFELLMLFFSRITRPCHLSAQGDEWLCQIIIHEPLGVFTVNSP